MIDYIKGEITELTPAYVVLETNGIGYFIQITLPTFSFLGDQTTAKIFVFESIREDAHVLYGFRYQSERQLFLLLISNTMIPPGCETDVIVAKYWFMALIGIIPK